MTEKNDTKYAKQFISKKKGWKTCAVSISLRSIIISTALGVYIGNWVDIYEFENVLAFVNNPIGDYSTSPIAPNSGRLQIHSRPLARYIQKKYDCCGSLKLSAWTDGEHVLFCKGTVGDNQKLHSGFVKITEPERLRYENSIRIVGDRFYVAAMFSEKLNSRLSLFESGNVFALISDPDGDLVTSNRNEFGTKTVHAPHLVRYVESKLGTGTLYGVCLHRGIAFSSDRLIAKEKVEVKQLKKLVENKVLQQKFDLKKSTMTMQFSNVIHIDELVVLLPENEINHMTRVGIFVEMLAAELPEIDAFEAKLIGEAAFYHDIGKINVPTSILLKETKLTDAEVNLIKMHPLHGLTIFDEIRAKHKSGFPDVLFEHAVESALYHHERWDGNGYPFGFKALQIPLVGRITAVCDAYDAITSARPYNCGKTHEQACVELERCSGTQFDPELVKKFLQNAAKFRSGIKFESICP